MDEETTVRALASPCTVLVTGASGFLGQHVVRLLQTRATHVTHIRILDLVPYVNKLDNDKRKPVKQFIGSINVIDLVMEACEGVNCVMHIASVVDIRMFPDRKLLEEVNVKGTEVLLDACRHQGVARFIYCSSAYIVIGYSDVIDGTEDATCEPVSFLMADYSITKCKAEKMVLQANERNFTTIALRAVGMYGEEDKTTGSMLLKGALKTGCYFDIDPDHVRQELAYVGNVAWMFICAENTMVGLTSNGLQTENNISGNAFFACDDTPLKSLTEFMKPIYEACELKRFPFKIHPCLLTVYTYCIYFMLLLVRFAGDVNFDYGPNVFYLRTFIHSFRYDKARKVLGYTPLYSYEESMRRSIPFYRSLR